MLKQYLTFFADETHTVDGAVILANESPLIGQTSCSTDPAHARPYMMLIEEGVDRSLNIPECSAAIGALTLRVQDTRRIPTDQTTGWLTYLMSSLVGDNQIIGQRVCVQQIDDFSLSPYVVADLLIQDIELESNNTVYKITTRDMKERERSLELFTIAANSVVWPFSAEHNGINGAGTTKGFGRLTSDTTGAYLLPAASGLRATYHRNADDVNVPAGHLIFVDQPFISDNGIDDDWHMLFGQYNVFSGTEGYDSAIAPTANGSKAMKNYITGHAVEWRAWGSSGAWTRLQNMPVWEVHKAGGATGAIQFWGFFSVHSKATGLKGLGEIFGISSGTVTEITGMSISAPSTATLPADGASVEFRVCSGMPPTDHAPLYEECSFGQFLKNAYDGLYSLENPGIKYSSGAMADFIYRTPTLRLIKPNIETDGRTWLNENVYKPMGYFAKVNDFGEIEPTPIELPQGGRDAVYINTWQGANLNPATPVADTGQAVAQLYGTFKRISNRLQPVTLAAGLDAEIAYDTLVHDGTVYWNIPTGPTVFFFVALGYVGPNDCVYMYYDGSSFELIEIVAGDGINRVKVSGTMTAGDTISLRRSGATYFAMQNGNLLLSLVTSGKFSGNTIMAFGSDDLNAQFGTITADANEFLPVLDQNNCLPTATWKHTSSDAITKVAFKYQRDFIQRDGTLGSIEVSSDILSAPGVTTNGDKTVSFAPETVRSVSGDPANSFGSAPKAQELGYMLSKQAQHRLIDRLALGGQHFMVEAQRFDPYVRGLREGDWVEVRLGWLPDYRNATRGTDRIMQIIQIQDHDQATRKLECVDGGPFVQPLPNLTGFAVSIAGLNNLTSSVATRPAGSDLAIYGCYSAAIPGDNGPWMLLDRKAANTILTENLPNGTFWVKARAEQVGHRPSPWTLTYQFNLAANVAVANPQVSFNDIGHAILTWKPGVGANYLTIYSEIIKFDLAATVPTPYYGELLVATGSYDLGLVAADQVCYVELQASSGITLTGNVGPRIPLTALSHGLNDLLFSYKATEITAAGTGTLEVTVSDPELKLLQVTGAGLQFYTIINGVKTAVGPSSDPTGTATGIWSYVINLDPKHNVIIEVAANFADGRVVRLGAWTFDNDKLANVVSMTSSSSAAFQRFYILFDTDVAIGANKARFRVDGGGWTTITVAADLTATFQVVQSGTIRHLIEVQGMDSDGNWGPTCFAETDVFLILSPDLIVTPTPGPTSYLLAWSSTNGSVTLSIDGAAYGTPSASPITVTRDANDHVYAFKVTIAGVSAIDTVTVPSLEKDTVSPDLSVTPGTMTPTTTPFTVTAANPSGGVAPTITVTPFGCTMIIGGTTFSTTQTISSGTVVTANRPVSTTANQAHIQFKATLSGGGTEEIDRSIPVQLGLGPSLDVKQQLNATTSQINWSGTGTIVYAVAGGSYSTPPASPITVSRVTNDQTYTFKASADSQDIIDSILVPALDKDTVAPDLQVIPGTPTSTTLPFTATATNPGGGTAPVISVTCADCSMVISGTTYPSGSTVTISSGTVVTANRPAPTQLTQATVKFRATISGGGAEDISRSIINQFSAGPSLDVAVDNVTTPGSSILTWSGVGTVTVKIDNGSYGTPTASPWTVVRDAVDHAYNFKAFLDNQTIAVPVVVPALGGAAGGPQFAYCTISVWSYAADQILIDWTATGAPGGATFNVTIYEQTAISNPKIGTVQTIVGVSPGYVYNVINDIDGSGLRTKKYTAFVEMISGANVVATSSTDVQTFNSNT